MPDLDFLGKGDVYAHHLTVPFQVLAADAAKSFLPKGGKPDLGGNLIIQGDNLKALKALLPRYEGKVNCIYIDPPYNTGNEGWVYNDNVNSPMITKWLGKAVDGDDQCRHDKWLCMMWPRLQLLKELLADDGVIFISIDDNEQHRLRSIMDEVFGEDNFVVSFIWTRKKKGSFLSKKIRKMSEYLICYTKTQNDLRFYGEDAYSDKWQPIVKRSNSLKELKIPKGFVQTTLKDGRYPKGARGNSETGINFLSDFQVSKNTVATELHVKGKFVWTQHFLDEEIKYGSQMALSNKFGLNVLRHDQAEKIKTPSTLINPDVGVGTNEDATQEIAEIFEKEIGETFDYNKPNSLISYLIKMVTFNHPNALILDSFAGSGTTAHAVLTLNKEDSGNRNFILVECEDYANKITAERVRRVIKGVKGAKDETLRKGLGGSFTYCTLGEELSEDKMLTGESLPDYETLAAHIFWTSTGETLRSFKLREDWFIGESARFRVYLVYKPDPTFLKSNDSALTGNLADKIAKRLTAGKKILVYAPSVFVGRKELVQQGIVFCQLPWAIHQRMG